jgi:WD40 repeat protein
VPRPERALEETSGLLGEFAAGLRELRDKAGKPTYRELSTLAHYSAAALSEAAGGRKLPSLAVTLAFVRACVGDTDEWEARWREVSAELATPEDPDPDESAPYVGLARFEIADADRFFGRDALTQNLVNRVRETRFLGVFGASGTGKSSLLRAGLLAKLGDADAIVLTPGDRPFDECAVHLSALSGESVTSVRDDLDTDPENLHLHIRRALAGRQEGTDLVLVVDQFEEVFTQCESADRDSFITALVHAAKTEGSRARVVLGIRADFYGHCGRYPQLLEALTDAQVLVGPMTPDELREAIVRPAAQANLSVGTPLVSRLMADTAGQPAVLPLLSHALLETWRRRSGMTLTLAGYEKSGGIQHALARTADEIYASLDPALQAAARNLFLRLVAINDDAEDTKRRLPRRELESLGEGTTVVLDELVAARLLTVDKNGVELAHEALIRHWPRLTDWLGDDRTGLRIHRQLTEAADSWESVGRDTGALYRGVRLNAAHDWMTSRERTLSQHEKEFLHASRAADLKRVRRLRQTIALLVCLVLAAVTTTVYAAVSQQEAVEQRNTALAQSIVSQADALSARDPALAAQFRLAAYRLTANTTTTGALLSATAEPYSSRLVGHTEPVRDSAISRDGRFLATASEDETVRLWDFSTPADPRELARIDHGDELSAVEFSPDSKSLAVGRPLERKIEIWSITDPRHPTPVGQPIRGDEARWSPDGRIFATMSMSTVDLLDITNSAQPVQRGSFAAESLPSFSLDGRTAAVQPAEGGSLLWDISDPAAPRPIETPFTNPDDIDGIDIIPDGKVLAVGVSRDDRWVTELWDMTNPRQLKRISVFSRPETEQPQAAPLFSPDGRSIITWGFDIQLWDISDLAHPRALHTVKADRDFPLSSVTLSPDGKSMVSSDDYDVRLTDLAAFAMAGLNESTPQVEFAKTGNILFGGAGHGQVRFWDVTDPAHPKSHKALPLPDGDTLDVAKQSPDGKVIVTETDDLTTELWDMSGSVPRKAATIEDGGRGLAMSTDGKMIATSSSPELSTLELGSLRSEFTTLWDITDVNHPKAVKLLEHKDLTNEIGARVDSRAFTSDGRHLVSATHKGVVQLWDITGADPVSMLVETGKGAVVTTGPDNLFAFPGIAGSVELWSADGEVRLVSKVAGHNGPINQLAISQDGTRLATGGADGTIRLWDIEKPSVPVLIGVLSGHTKPVHGVAFSPDGRRIATSSDDGTVRLWETDLERIAERVCRTALPRLDKAEWQRYLPDVPFQTLCP